MDALLIPIRNNRNVNRLAVDGAIQLTASDRVVDYTVTNFVASLPLVKEAAGNIYVHRAEVYTSGSVSLQVHGDELDETYIAGKAGAPVTTVYIGGATEFVVLYSDGYTWDVLANYTP